MAFTLPVASAGLVEVYVNNSEDLVIAEEAVTIPYGKDFTLTFQVGGPYRIESGDDNLSAYSINMDVRFLNDLDNRADCSMCAIPSYQTLGDTEEDTGYDEYVARFYSDSEVFEGYSGDIQFAIMIKNRTGGLVWDRVLDVKIASAPSGSSSSGFSIPELPPVIEDNLLVVGGGILAVIILAILINTFILATEDTTAELYKVKESIDPLSKSLTGVSYETDLPGEEEEKEEEDDDDYTEDILGEEEEEFDESKLLAELTGPQKLQSDDEKEEEPEPPVAEPKKPARKKVVKRTVAKKVVRKAAPPQAAPPQAAPKKPEVNMGEGIISITCPSCEKVHNVDEDTLKFICGCGRRIRLN